MPIDTHVRIAAWLNIVLGTLAACVVVLFGSVFGVSYTAAIQQSGLPGAPGWAIGLFTAFIIYFLAYLALAILGGVLLLRGKPAGRVITIIFSVLSLVNFPVGTLLGGYCLWALLRTGPIGSVSVQVNVVRNS